MTTAAVSIRSRIEKASRPARAHGAAKRLQHATRRARTIEDILDITFSFDTMGVNIRPWQSRYELGKLLERVGQVQPRRMLEIGTANGGSLFAFACVCAPDAHIVSVDLPEADFGGGYEPWRLSVYKAFVRHRQRLDLLRLDSHQPSTLAEVRRRLGGPLDFLFIDGDHTYAGVKADYEAYRALVREGGLIAFHDIVPLRAASDGGDPGDVHRFWREINSDGEGLEFIDPGRGRGGAGIGVLTV